jgi:hypothetical protein
VDEYLFSCTRVKLPIRQLSLVDAVLEIFLESGRLNAIVEFEDVDIMQIVEILAVETSESNHTASNKPCAMSASWFWDVLRVSTDFDSS